MPSSLGQSAGRTTRPEVPSACGTTVTWDSERGLPQHSATAVTGNSRPLEAWMVITRTQPPPAASAPQSEAGAILLAASPQVKLRGRTRGAQAEGVGEVAHVAQGREHVGGARQALGPLVLQALQPARGAHDVLADVGHRSGSARPPARAS